MATLPDRFIKRDHISDMVPGQDGWISAKALVIGWDQEAYINPEETVYPDRRGLEDAIRISHPEEDVYNVSLLNTSHRWCIIKDLPTDLYPVSAIGA